MITDLLGQIVVLKSIYPGEYRLGKFLVGQLTGLGFRVSMQRVASNRFNVLATKGSGANAILYYGHMDTIPLKGSWSTDPFILTKRADRLYGLGSWDMKGGMASILSAVDGFDPKGFALKVAFVVDEENISLGMHTLIQSGWLSNVVAAVAPEPGFVYGHQGITIGRTGRSVYRVIIKTKGGHVYLVGKRLNAINEAYRFLEAVNDFKKIHHKDLGECVIFPRYIHGGANAMSVPEEVEIELEAQLVPPQTTRSVLKQLRSIVATANVGSSITIESVERETPFCNPFVISKSSPFVGMVQNILGRVIGRKPVLHYRHSVADENRIASLGIPVVTVGPSGGNAHEPNEWVSQRSIGFIEQFLRQLLLSYNEFGVE